MHFHNRFVKQRDVQLYCFLSTPQPNTGALESSLVRFLKMLKDLTQIWQSTELFYQQAFKITTKNGLYKTANSDTYRESEQTARWHSLQLGHSLY